MNAMQSHTAYRTQPSPIHSVGPALTVKSDAVAYGSALYAERAYQAGEIVARFNDAKPAQKSYLTVQVGADEHLELTVLSHMNHSCRPNLVLDAATRTVTACRPIARGDMLSFFYPSTEWHMDRPFVCGCGERDCVRFVAGARYLSADVLSRYYINAHIVQALRDSLTCGKVSS